MQVKLSEEQERLISGVLPISERGKQFTVCISHKYPHLGTQTSRENHQNGQIF